jgi:pimeloyl-ACP methyl ester carboxylesterase
MILALLGTAWITRPIQAQQTPTPVIADPIADKQFPPGLSVLTIPSTGSEMDAFFYLASGAGPHGTVVLLHGLPGYEINGDLAQSIRRAGWNVLLFNYRGTWGSTGIFSQSSAIEDTAAVVRFLRDPASIATYRIDPRRLVIIGHSFGGFLAGYEGSHDPDIIAIGIISATNLGRINFDPKERDSRLKRWQTQLHPVHGATASDLSQKPNGMRKNGTTCSGPMRYEHAQYCSSKPTIRTTRTWKRWPPHCGRRVQLVWNKRWWQLTIVFLITALRYRRS